MFIIAGLGNPGARYAGTKHNAGFDVIDILADRHSVSLSKTSMKALYGKTVISGQACILIKPLTYMNLSGEAVSQFVNYYNADPASSLIVIYDDIDLEPGNIRIRKKGSAGSHNGMKNIVRMLGTDIFPRVRIGTGAKPEGWDLADYVLAPFDSEARKLVDGAEERAADAVEMIVGGDTDGAMGKYNHKITGQAQESDL